MDFNGWHRIFGWYYWTERNLLKVIVIFLSLSHKSWVLIECLHKAEQDKLRPYLNLLSKNVLYLKTVILKAQ